MGDQTNLLDRLGLQRAAVVEAGANVAVGYGLAIATQLLVPGRRAPTLGQNLAIGLIFTVVSLVRSYALRRAFEAILARSARLAAAATL